MLKRIYGLSSEPRPTSVRAEHLASLPGVIRRSHRDDIDLGGCASLQHGAEVEKHLVESGVVESLLVSCQVLVSHI